MIPIEQKAPPGDRTAAENASGLNVYVRPVAGAE